MNYLPVLNNFVITRNPFLIIDPLYFCLSIICYNKGAKIRAATKAIAGGVPSVVIASGLNPHSVEQVVCGER